MAQLQLLIADKNLSSWSMRPWVALTEAQIPFEEVQVPFLTPGWREQVLAWSPAGRVPVLRHGELRVWESLAICEYLAEQFPVAGLWPEDPAARAVARAVSAEMHAGFSALRNECSMNLTQREHERPPSAEAMADVRRVTQLWTDCRARFGKGGQLLFGRFSIADAMFAPVAARFVTYGLPAEGEAALYLEALLELRSVRSWFEGAKAEVARGFPRLHP